jgi:hypothetical protein
MVIGNACMNAEAQNSSSKRTYHDMGSHGDSIFCYSAETSSIFPGIVVLNANGEMIWKQHVIIRILSSKIMKFYAQANKLREEK